MVATVEKAIRERPILFNGPMVKAILEGRKTQTRRVVKPQPPKETGFGITGSTYSNPNDFHALFFRGPTVESTGMGVVKSPYGKPGDRLWVRETWHLWGPPEWQHLDYAATNPQAADLKWKPSIFMPRWASRITLEITNMRVERLQGISGYDACHEGAPYEQILENGRDGRDYRKGFQQFWESINGKKYPWSTNPWVWVVEFKRVEVPV